MNESSNGRDLIAMGRSRGPSGTQRAVSRSDELSPFRSGFAVRRRTRSVVTLSQTQCNSSAPSHCVRARRTLGLSRHASEGRSSSGPTHGPTPLSTNTVQPAIIPCCAQRAFGPPHLRWHYACRVARCLVPKGSPGTSSCGLERGQARVNKDHLECEDGR